MPFTTAPAPLFSLQLQPAQRAWERVPRGAEIEVLAGAICLHRREYLAGMWVDLPVLLRAGERHRAGTTGWLELEAVGGARLRLTPTRGWTAWAGQMLARYRGLKAWPV